MKKNLFSTMLALLTIVAMLVSVGCKNYDDDISDINKKISDLETSTTTLSGTVSSLQSAVTTLQSGVSKAQSAAEAAQKTADAAASAADVAQDAAEEAQAAADEAQKAADKAQETADAAMKAAEAAQGTADEGVKAAEAAQKAAEAADAKAVAADLAAKAAQAAADKAEADAVAAQAAANAAAATANAAATKAEFEAFQKLAAEADSTLAASIAANKELINTNSEDIEAAGKLIKENMANIAKLQGLVAAAQTSIETIQTNLEALQNIVDGNVTEIKSLTDRAVAMEAKLVEIMETISADTTTVSKLATAFVELREQFKEHMTEFENHQKAFEELKVAISSAHTQFTTDIAELQSSVSEIKTTIDAVKNGLQSQIDDLRADFEKKCGELSAKDEELLAEITEQTYRIDTAYFKISSLAKYVDDIKNMVDNNADMINELLNMVNNNSIAISDNAAAIEDLRQALKDSTAYWVAYLLAQDAENAKNIEANSYSIALNTLAIGANADLIEACEAAIAGNAASIAANGDAIKALQDAMESAKGRITALEEAVEATKLYCAVYVEEAKALLLEEIDGVRAELTQKLEELEAKVDANIASLDSKFQGKVDELSAQIKTINETLEGKIQVIEESYAKKLKELDGKVDKNAEETAEALAALETAYKEADKGLETAYQAADAALQTQIDALTAQLSDAKAAFETQIKAANDSIGKVSENVEAVKAALAAQKEAAEAQIAELKELIGAKGDTTSVKVLTAKLAVLEAQLAEINNTTIPGLQNQISANETRIEANEAAIATLQASLTTVQADIEKIKEQIADHETRVKNLETSVNELQEDVESLAAQIQSISFIPRYTAAGNSNYIDVFRLDATTFGSAGYYALRGTSVMDFSIRPADKASSIVDACQKAIKESTDLPLKVNFEVTKAEVSQPVITKVELKDASKGIITVFVQFSLEQVKTFTDVKETLKASAISIGLASGKTDIQSAYVVNKPRPMALAFDLTDQNYKESLPKTNGEYDPIEYTRPWNATLSESSQKLFADKTEAQNHYVFGFYLKAYTDDDDTKTLLDGRSSYTDDYVSDGHTYITLDELRYYTNLDLKAVYKPGRTFDTSTKKFDAYTVDHYAADGATKLTDETKWKINVSCADETEDWIPLGTNMQVASFDGLESGDKGRKIVTKQSYAIRCGSLDFTNSSSIETIYTIIDSWGDAFTVNPMGQTWSYDTLLTLNKRRFGSEPTDIQKYSDTVSLTRFEKPVEYCPEYYLQDNFYYPGTVTLSKKNANGGYDVVSVYNQAQPTQLPEYSKAYAQVSIDKNAFGEAGFKFVLNRYEWNSDYKIVWESLSQENKIYKVTAQFVTGKKPGTVVSSNQTDATSGLVYANANDRIIELGNSDAEAIQYSAEGNWTTDEAWDNLVSKYSEYFDQERNTLATNMTNDLWSAGQNSNIVAFGTYIKEGTSYKKLSGDTTPAIGQSDYLVDGTPMVKKAQTQQKKVNDKMVDAWRGYIDPVSVTAISNQYRQVMSVKTWTGITFVVRRDITVSLEGYTLQPNILYVGDDNVVKLRGNSEAAPWKFDNIDLSSARYFYVDEINFNAVKYTYTTNIWDNKPSGQTPSPVDPGNASPMYHTYKVGTATNYEEITYLPISQNSSDHSELIFKNVNAQETYNKTHVTKDVWVKVTAQVQLNGASGPWVTLNPKYFKYTIVNPIESFGPSSTSAVMTFKPGNVVTAIDSQVKREKDDEYVDWTNPAAWLSMKASDGQDLISYPVVPETTVAGVTTPAHYGTSVYKYLQGTNDGFLTGVGDDANFYGLLIDVDNAKFYIDGVEKPANTIADQVSGHYLTLKVDGDDSYISMKCKDVALAMHEVKIEIPVVADHNIFNTKWTYDTEADPLTPFMIDKVLTITVKTK